MYLKNLISHWLEKRKLAHYEELDKIIGSLVENYRKKLMLLINFQSRKINEEDFTAKFLALLKIEMELEAMEESVSHDKNLRIEIRLLKDVLITQKECLNRWPQNYPHLIAKIKEEEEILGLEQKQIKELEQKLLFPNNITQKEIKINIDRLKQAGLSVDPYRELAVLLATNWNLTELLVKKLNLEDKWDLFANSLPKLANYIKSKEDLILLVEFANKLHPEYLNSLLICLKAFLDKGLVHSREEFRRTGLLLIELANKTKPEHVTILLQQGFTSKPIKFLLQRGLTGNVPLDFITSLEDLAMLVKLINNAKPEYKLDIILCGLPSFAYLIKNKADLTKVILFLIKLSNKMKFQDFGALLKYCGTANVKNKIKSIDDLEKINAMLPELITKSHALYSSQPQSFFKPTATIIRKQFRKTGSKTILLGGRLVGKAIIRIVKEPAFLAWKKAFEAKEIWQKYGFDYMPVEPILSKKEQLRAYQTKKGNYYRVYTKVLGISLERFLDETNDTELIEQLTNLRNKIKDVIENIIRIEHGHLHDRNFCVEIQDDKIRLYAIDFDQAVSY